MAITAGVVLGALRLHRFTPFRDGDALRHSRGLLGKQTATIPAGRVQAVRIVEGFWRLLLGYCSLQVEVAGIRRANTNQRMLLPDDGLTTSPVVLRWRLLNRNTVIVYRGGSQLIESSSPRVLESSSPRVLESSSSPRKAKAASRPPRRDPDTGILLGEPP